MKAYQLFRNSSCALLCLGALGLASAHAEDSTPTQAPEATDSVALQAQQILDLFDKNKDERLCRNEYAHAVMNTFEALDENEDGILASTELEQSECDSVKKADTDHDSKLSFTEIIEHQKKEFDEKDLNHDGYLSRDEIESSIRAKLEELQKH